MKARVLIALAGGAVFGQVTFQVASEVKQGYTLRIDAPQTPDPRGLSASFIGKKIRFYADGTGSYALLPAPALTPPGPVDLTVKDAAGTIIFSRKIQVTDAQYPEQNIVTSPRMRSLKTSDEETKRMAAFRASTGEKKMWAEPFQHPTPECSNSPFGVRRLHDGKLTGNIHAGLDFRSPKGRAIHAVTPGVVKVARMFPRQGGTVGIDHGQGLQTTYIHMSKIAAVEGTTVTKGQVIGYVGSTGFATGPHLHFTVHVNAVPVNPLQWVPGVEACK